jgi:hypothetical protein
LYKSPVKASAQVFQKRSPGATKKSLLSNFQSAHQQETVRRYQSLLGSPSKLPGK